MKQEIWLKAVFEPVFYSGQIKDRVKVSFKTFSYSFRFKSVKNAEQFLKTVQGKYNSGKEVIQKLRKTHDECQGEESVYSAFMFFSSLMEND